MKDKQVRQVSEFNNELKLKGFNVFQIESDGAATRIYSRKDFYKICLTKGKSKIHYADRSFEQEGTILFLVILISLIHGKQFQLLTRAMTLFSEEFFKASERTESLQHSPLFKIAAHLFFK
jgi:hypothetical protein